MFRSLLALIVLSFLASDASACNNAAARPQRRHPVRNLAVAVVDVVTMPMTTGRDRIVHRERHVQRGNCAAGVVVPAPVAMPCPAGKCPMKK